MTRSYYPKSLAALLGVALAGYPAGFAMADTGRMSPEARIAVVAGKGALRYLARVHRAQAEQRNRGALSIGYLEDFLDPGKAHERQYRVPATDAERLMRTGQYPAAINTPTSMARNCWTAVTVKPGERPTRALDALYDADPRHPTLTHCSVMTAAAIAGGVHAVLGREKFDAIFIESSEQQDGVFLKFALGQMDPLLYFLKPLQVRPAGMPTGAFVYFNGVQNYLSKHPAGSSAGFNLLVAGQRDGEHVYRGFGLPDISDGDMRRFMAKEYDLPRTALDEQILRTKDHAWATDMEAAGIPETADAEAIAACGLSNSAFWFDGEKLLRARLADPRETREAIHQHMWGSRP